MVSRVECDRLMRLDQPYVSETAKVQKSIYGICQPIKPVFVPVEKDSPSLNQTEKELRLIRLLEKQQEWYDAREQARVRANPTSTSSISIKNNG